MLSSNYNPDVLTCLANLSNDEVFTPPSVVNQILDLLPEELWSDKTCTFLDPVSKSGVFLREIAKRLIIGLETEFPDQEERLNHIYHNQIFGIAITELTALLSRRSTYCSKIANSYYSICGDFENEQGNIIFKRVEHSWKVGKCTFCGASEASYGRNEKLETHAYEFIHTNQPEGIFDMKFDVIVGNPPYQLSDGGHGTSASPIYQLFIEKAIALNPRFISMIVPARWYTGGKGLGEFRKNFLSDDRIKEIHDFPDATNLFPGVQIKGGICYFLWSKDYRGDCSINNYKDGELKSTKKRPLLETNCDTLIRYNQAISILDKVKSHGENNISSLVSARKPFGLNTTYKGKVKPFKDSIFLYQNGGVGHIAIKDIEKNTDLITKFKVYIPRAGSGSDSFPHTILGKPFVGKENTACTETYLTIGPLSSENEANNLCRYITTRFFRFLILLLKNTQDATSKVYQFVPAQNFNEDWDDEKLYEKYGISDQEISFIETMIKPMDTLI